MSNTPTTGEIAIGVKTSLEGTLNQVIPLLPRSFIDLLAKAVAGVASGLYKYGNRTGLNIFIRTASIKETAIGDEILIPLVELGRELGVSDPVQATQAELLIDITVNVQAGQINSGQQLLNSDNGVTYIVIGDVLLDAPVVQASVRAVADQQDGGGEGVIGNLDPGAELSFADPLPNINRIATVVTQLVTGAEGEDLDTAYRQRVFDFSTARPQGGAYADYRIWGVEVAGIINVYPYTGDPGQVNVYSEATVESSGSADGIPTGAQLTAVFDSIELNENGLATRRNVNAFVNSLAITRTGFDVVVDGISGVDNLAQTVADVEAALREYFLDREPFIVGLDVPPRRDKITRSQILGVIEDIVTAANGIFITATFNLTGLGGSIELYLLGEGEKAKAVTVSFI